MELTLALICDGARERPDGRLDVSGVFDELSAPGFPALQKRMTVVFVMEWGAEEAGSQEFRADLVGEGDIRILTIEGGTEVPSPSGRETPPRTRLVLPLEDVVFPKAGRYRFVLFAGGDEHRACTIHLRGQPAPPPIPDA